MRYSYVIEVLPVADTMVVAVNGEVWATFVLDQEEVHLRHLVASSINDIEERIRERAQGQVLHSVIHDARDPANDLWVAYTTTSTDTRPNSDFGNDAGVLAEPPTLPAALRYAVPGAAPESEATAPSYVTAPPTHASTPPPAARTTRYRGAPSAGEVAVAGGPAPRRAAPAAPQRPNAPAATTATTTAAATDGARPGVVARTKAWWAAASTGRRVGAVAGAIVAVGALWVLFAPSNTYNAVCVDVRTEVRTLDAAYCDGPIEYYKWYYYQGGDEPQVNAPYLREGGTYTKPSGNTKYLRDPAPLVGDENAPAEDDREDAPPNPATQTAEPQETP